MSESWIETDEADDVVASLSVCALCLREIHEQPELWKWVIVSAHSALQGAIVCHLSGTAQIGALEDKSITARQDWHERDRRGEIVRREVEGEIHIANPRDNPPDPRLASPDVLFLRLRRADKRRERAGGEIKVCASEARSFRKLNSLRREFAHFTPKGWSIEISGLPLIVSHMMNLIERISEDYWPFRHLDEVGRTRLRELLHEIRSRLDEVTATQ